MASKTALFSSVLTKLQQLEGAVHLRGGSSDYADLADANFVESNSSKNSGSVSVPPGLAKLEASCHAILAELQAVQEGIYSNLRNDVRRCKDFYASSSSVWRSILDAAAAPSSSGAKQQPHTSTEASLATRRRDLVTKQLQRWLQEIHDAAGTSIDSQLQAFEVITFCFDSYARSLVALIDETDDEQQRVAKVSKIVQPRLAAILSHPALQQGQGEAAEFISQARSIWADAFCGQRQALAERKLLQSSTIHRQSSVTYTKMGAGAVMTLWSFSECFNNEQAGREIWHDPTFAIFMCFGDLLLLLWLWGLSMQIWRACGIDFVALLQLEKTEVDARRSPELVIYTAATDLTLLFLSTFICFNKAARGVFNVPGSLAIAHVLPVLMVVYFLYCAIMPFQASRQKWLSFLWQVIAAPCYIVSFRDSYIGDLLTSLVRVLIPMCFSFAYLIMSALAWLTNNMSAAASTSDLWWQDSAFFRLFLVPFLTLFPLWIRLMQCLRRSVETGKRWPHMANALKYTSAIVVISFGTFCPPLRSSGVWIVSFVGATLFQFVWDLTMDWGLIVRATARSASSSGFMGLSLRHTRLLGPAWLYVLTISVNLLLRFAWTLTLLPQDLSVAERRTLYGIVMSHIAPLIAAGEVARRMVWGIFRLENEQLEALGPPEVHQPGGTEEMAKMDVQLAAASEAGCCPTLCSDTDWSHSPLAPFAPLAQTTVVNSCPATVLGSEALQHPHSRLRLVESVVFAAAVAMVVLLAAVSHER